MPRPHICDAMATMTTVTKQTAWLRRVGLGLGLAGLALTTEPVRAAPVDTMPVEDVRPGMKGYAVTVFSGTDSDRFEIEVIDVVRDYLPKQDAILFRSNDPRMVHSGIV